MQSREEVFGEIKEAFGLIPSWTKEVPDTALAAFWGLMRDFYLAETEIPKKYKELIGLGVAGATRCAYCALFHTEGARLNGATDREIAEASMMAGVSMAASTFINAQQVDYDQFRAETTKIVAHVRKQMVAQGKTPPRPQPHAHA